MPTLRRFVLFILLTSLSIGGVVAIISFSQNVPSVTVVTQLAPGCGTAGGTPLTATPSSVLAGSSGNILFSCGTGPALTVTNGPVPVTPTFTATSYTGVWIINAGSSQCPSTGAIGGVQLTSGTQLSLVTGTFDYCASFSSASGGSLGAFTVAWS